jgi:outer membrane protein TolC
LAWERARSQAAALGIARSELYPTLAAAALSQTGRSEVLFGNSFVSQVVQNFQVVLDLNYNVFDFLHLLRFFAHRMHATADQEKQGRSD